MNLPLFIKHILASATVGLSIAAMPMAAAQELAPSQTLRLGLGVDDIRTLDPHFSTGVGEIAMVEFTYESLVKFPDGKIVPNQLEPGLAESWARDDTDELSWTFKLREGVQFHEGYGEMTADDVVFSLERLRSEETASPFSGNISVIDQVEKVGPYEVRITTKSPVADLPALLVNANKTFIMSKAASEAGVEFRTHPIGTGPFTYDAYNPRESFNLKRHDDYWGGQATIERIIARFMSNSSTRELALRRGDVHAIDIESTEDAVNRMRKAGMEVDLTAPANAFVLYFNPTIKPFDDIKVRQALSHAIDRDAMLQYLGAEVSSAEISPLPKGYRGHTDSVQQYEFDPDKAKALLAEAGYPDGLEFKLPISNNNIYLQPMQIIQEQWRSVGVNVELGVVDHPTYHRLIRQNVSPAVIYGAYRYPLDGNRYLNEFYHSRSIIGTPTASTNFSHYDKVDAELDQARVSPDAAEQETLWATAQEKIMADTMAVPLFTRKYALARSPKLDLGHAQESYSFYTLSTKTRLLK